MARTDAQHSTSFDANCLRRNGRAQRAADYLHSLQPAKEPEPPEAVLRAMEDADEPLPDAVAAAWAS
jgi:hypothetical protein